MKNNETISSFYSLQSLLILTLSLAVLSWADPEGGQRVQTSHPGKLQVAICCLKILARIPLEKQLDPEGSNRFSREFRTALCESVKFV